jgi:poly(3-hydroxybutyrate) depolymerase
MSAARCGRIAALILLLAPAALPSQALPSLATLRVGYNTRKATARPEGALKARIDSVDAAINEATRQGRTGEVRRLIAKGTTLLAGRPWTDTTDYASSLVLRSDRVVVDPARPYVVRLEQIYAPSIQLRTGLVAKASLRARGGGGPPAQAAMKQWDAVGGVSRDLRESPHILELDLRAVPDGDYVLTVEVSSPAQPLGSANLSLHIKHGLDSIVARLEDAAKRAPENVRSDVLYPLDRMRHVNVGRIELRTFDPARDFAAADSIAVAARSGTNPFATRTGDFKRHYPLDSADEIMPYRVYVPTRYTSSRPFPLVIALHGLGGTEDSFFSSYSGVFPRLAEERGYLVAAPLGYRVDGWYGWGVGNPPADPEARRVQQLSEADVMHVLALMRRQYNVDSTRIYLMGHSMGAIGTWRMAPKFPDIWAAVGAFSGAGTPATLERIRHVPNFVVHGDADATVNVEGSRAMVAKMKELGIEVRYIEVPGGNHTNVVVPNAAAMFDFFDAHRKGVKR